MNGEPEQDAVCHGGEQSKRCVDQHDNQGQDSKRLYEELAKRHLNRRNASQVSTWGGVYVSPQPHQHHEPVRV